MASATSAASVRGQCPAVSEARGGPKHGCHSERPKAADTVIEATKRHPDYAMNSLRVLDTAELSQVRPYPRLSYMSSCAAWPLAGGAGEIQGARSRGTRTERPFAFPLRLSRSDRLGPQAALYQGRAAQRCGHCRGPPEDQSAGHPHAPSMGIPGDGHRRRGHRL